MWLSFVFDLNAKHLYNQTHSVLPSNKIYGSIWSQKGLFSKMFCKSEPYIKYTEQIQNNALHPNLRSCANYYNWYKWLAKWNKEPVAVLLSLSLSLSVYFCLCISLSLPLCSLSVSLFLSLLHTITHTPSRHRVAAHVLSSEWILMLLRSKNLKSSLSNGPLMSCLCNCR